MTNFKCDCGNDTFEITTQSMIGEDRTYINEIVCDECGASYLAKPTPSYLEKTD